jgi:hypothetical protein
MLTHELVRRAGQVTAPEPGRPLRNRVTPFGEIAAVPERGTLFGNRGILHDDNKRLVRTSQVRRWLICVLEFKGIHRTVMTPHRYTELFFLDEATALAAGHRPCCECRRQAYREFQAGWRAGVGGSVLANDMDRRLAAERRLRGAKVTYQAPCAGLPDGVFIAADGQAWLLRAGQALRWTPGGYTERAQRPDGTVTVLTPPSTVAVLRHGYPPALHPTAHERAQPTFHS